MRDRSHDRPLIFLWSFADAASCPWGLAHFLHLVLPHFCFLVLHPPHRPSWLSLLLPLFALLHFWRSIGMFLPAVLPLVCLALTFFCIYVREEERTLSCLFRSFSALLSGLTFFTSFGGQHTSHPSKKNQRTEFLPHLHEKKTLGFCPVTNSRLATHMLTTYTTHIHYVHHTHEPDERGEEGGWSASVVTQTTQGPV